MDACACICWWVGGGLGLGLGVGAGVGGGGCVSVGVSVCVRMCVHAGVRVGAPACLRALHACAGVSVHWCGSACVDMHLSMHFGACLDKEGISVLCLCNTDGVLI
jgi:hypothetical protein